MIALLEALTEGIIVYMSYNLIDNVLFALIVY
jgi:hypothetical protein